MNRERCNGFKPGINQERLTIKDRISTKNCNTWFENTKTNQP